MDTHPAPAHHHNSSPDVVDRVSDVAIVGGSAAGLAAALQLARQRRSVIVIDGGEPRNAPASHMHGYLGYEGHAPETLVATGRAEVRSYGGEVLTDRVEQVMRADDGRFEVLLASGHQITARRILAATGLVDELPDIEGLAQHWGGAVIHCPFCHGFEVRDRRIVAIVTHPTGLHQVALFRHLTSRLTAVIHDDLEVDASQLDALQTGGVHIVRTPVRRVVNDTVGNLAAVELADGKRLDADAITIGPRFRVRAEPFASLGLHPTEHPSGLGDAIEVDEMGATSIFGLYAAGNVTDPGQQVLHAAAQGARVGAMISFSLAHDDLEAAVRPSGNEADWDRRYAGEQMWSGAPNPALVAETSALQPGRVLDIGAGEGGDALWLAAHGWRVTASDISQRALDRIAAEADGRALAVECLHADANALGALPTAAFDLVTAHYASIPRSPDHRAVGNLLDAVASGGTLLVVSHDFSHQGPARPFDPDAYVQVDDVVAVLEATPGWTIQVHETRPRGDHGSNAPNDVVLRARRHG